MTTQMTPAITRALAYAQGECDAMTQHLPDDVPDKAEKIAEGRACLVRTVDAMRADDESEDGIIRSMLDASCMARDGLRLMRLVEEMLGE